MYLHDLEQGPIRLKPLWLHLISTRGMTPIPRNCISQICLFEKDNCEGVCSWNGWSLKIGQLTKQLSDYVKKQLLGGCAPLLGSGTELSLTNTLSIIVTAIWIQSHSRVREWAAAMFGERHVLKRLWQDPILISEMATQGQFIMHCVCIAMQLNW